MCCLKCSLNAGAQEAYKAWLVCNTVVLILPAPSVVLALVLKDSVLFVPSGYLFSFLSDFFLINLGCRINRDMCLVLFVHIFSGGQTLIALHFCQLCAVFFAV